MGTFYQRVDLYKRNTDGTFPTSPTQQIYDAYNFNIPKGTAKVKDIFSFNIVNANNKYFSGGVSTFEIGDMVKIYMWKDTTSPTIPDDLMMDGLITQPDETINDKGRVINIKGVSRIEYLFATIVPLSLKTKTLPVIITEILLQILQLNRLGNSGFGFKFVYLGMEYSATNISGTPTSHSNTISNVMSDATAFTDTWDATANYEQATALLEKYSSFEFTKDPGSNYPYIYYLDNENYFWWIPRGGTADATYKIEEGVNATQIKCKWEDDVYNALILNCGIGPNSRGITTFVANYSSVTRYGVRWKYVATTSSYGESLMNEDVATNPSSFTPDSRYPTAYNYTTAWNAKRAYASAPVMTAGQPVVVSSDTEYLTAIRRTAQDMGKEEGNKILEQMKGAKLVIQSEFSMNNNYAIAGLYTHSVPSYNITSQNLRLVQLANSFWSTNPDSEEDTETKARQT